MSRDSGPTGQKEEEDKNVDGVTPEVVFDDLCSRTFSAPEVAVVVAAKQDNSPFPDIRELHALKDLKEIFLGIVDKHIRITAKRRDHPLFRFEQYNEGHHDGKYLVEWEELGASLNQNVHSMVEAFQGDGDYDDGSDGSRKPLHRFDQNADEFIEQLFYYGVAIREKDRPTLYALREYASRYEILHSSRWFAFQRHQTEFDLYNDRMFSFDGYIDVIIYRGFVFVFKRSGFRKIFDYGEMVTELAEQALKEIHEARLVSNIKEFREAVLKMPTMKQKLANMTRSGSIEGVDIEAVQVQLEDVELDGTVGLTDDGSSILYEPTSMGLEDLWRILNILDSSFYRSRLNDRVYLSSTKRVV